MQHEEGLEPDNFIDPRDLSDMERRNLKEALGVVGEIKGRLKSEYRLDVGLAPRGRGRAGRRRTPP
jgi:CBS domain-containing protein